MKAKMHPSLCHHHIATVIVKITADMKMEMIMLMRHHEKARMAAIGRTKIYGSSNEDEGVEDSSDSVEENAVDRVDIHSIHGRMKHPVTTGRIVAIEPRKTHKSHAMIDNATLSSAVLVYNCHDRPTERRRISEFDSLSTRSAASYELLRFNTKRNKRPNDRGRLDHDDRVVYHCHDLESTAENISLP
jgi:hypothetical protein